MKKLNVLLALIIVFNLMSSAFATDSKVDSLYNSDLSKLSNNKALFVSLGIEVPNSNTYSDYVKRSEFISVLMQLTNVSSHLSAELPYTDVAPESDLANSLAYAMALGVVSPSDKFNPDNIITYNEAYKMSLVLLGRKYEAEVGGGFPIGYLRLASKYGLNKGLKYTADTQLNIYDFYVLLRNIVTADALIPEVVMEEGVKYTSNTTILKLYFDLHEVRGIVTADSNTALFEPNFNTKDGKIKINNEVYSYDGEIKVGESVKGYAKDVESESKILFLELYKSETKSIKFDDVIEKKDGYIKYDDGDISEQLDLAEPLAIIYNGKAENKISLSNIDLTNGYLELIDNNDDGTYEVAHVYKYTTMLVQSVNTYDKLIIDVNGQSPLDLSEQDMKYTVYNQKGKAELTNIEPGNLILVYLSTDKMHAKIQVNSSTMTGAVTGYSYSDKNIYINDKMYEYSDYFSKYYEKRIIIGTEYEFMLSDDGLVQAVQDNQAGSMKYGYIVNVAKTKGVEKEVELRIFTQYGKLETYTVAKKAKLEGKTIKNIDDIYNKFRTGDVINRMIVRFEVNSSNLISAIDTQQAADRLPKDNDYYDNLTKFEFPSSVATTLWYIRENNTFHPYFKVAGDTAIFIVVSGDGIEDEKRCTIKTVDYFKANQGQPSATLNAYNVTESGIAGAIVVVDNSAINASVTESSKSGIVHSVTAAIDDEGMITNKVVIYHDAYFYRYYVSEDFLSSFKTLGIDKGDCIRFENTSDNRLTAASLDFDMSAMDLKKRMADNGTGVHTAKGALYFGMVYVYEDDMITIIPNHIKDVTPDVDNKKARFSFPMAGRIISVDTKTAEIKDADKSEIISYLQGGSLANNVLIRTNDGQMALTVLYK